MIDSLHSFDVDLFLRINRGLSNGFFDWLMPLVRNRFFWSPLYLFIIVFCIKQYGKKGFYIIGGLLLTFALGDFISASVIKPFITRLRPCNDISLSNLMISRVPCGSGYSFPSAHATNHFGIAVFLIVLFYPKWKAILPLGLAWAFLVALSQIYVGVHYPLDTLAGGLLGTSIGIITGKTLKKYQPEL